MSHEIKCTMLLLKEVALHISDIRAWSEHVDNLVANV